MGKGVIFTDRHREDFGEGFGAEEDTYSINDNKYWPALADVMSAGALIILLFMLFSYIQALDFASAQSQIYGQLEEALSLEFRILEELERVIAQEIGEENVSLNRKDLSLNVQGEIFFDRNSYKIKPEAKPVLDKLAQAFTVILANEEYRSRISAILIEGHCDETGTADINWQLSVDRAVEVVKFLHHTSPELGTEFPRYFGAAGYSKFRPPELASKRAEHDRDTTISESDSRVARRIEIRIIPRYEGVKEQIDRILGMRVGRSLRR